LEIVRVDNGVDDERLEVGGAEGGGEARAPLSPPLTTAAP
jgi:hypothetical protein